MATRWELLLIAVLVCLDGGALARRSSMVYYPEGKNPLLYTPGIDPIMHLDETTFDDTVFAPEKNNSFIIEFYADWCGDCRAYIGEMKNFSLRAEHWSDVCQVAAIDCADIENLEVCRGNNVTRYPTVKYFPRYSTSYSNGSDVIQPGTTEGSLIELLPPKIVDEYELYGHREWPNFTFIDANEDVKIEALWEGVDSGAKYLAIIFANAKDDGASVRVLLDMWRFRDIIGVRRALSDSPIAKSLDVKEFPNVVVFRRDDNQKLDILPDHLYAIQEVLDQMLPVPRIEQVLNCTKTENYAACAKMFYVSETDLLKGIRTALHDDVVRKNLVIEGENFQNLYKFVSMLAEHLPTKESRENEADRPLAKRKAPKVLRRSSDAKAMFEVLRQELDNHQGNITAQEWRDLFEAEERAHGNPFPTDANWQHCRGTTPLFRGYTCSLWTAFHTLTVNAYLDNQKAQEENTHSKPVLAIRGWIESFFGCEHCRLHFVNMTKNDKSNAVEAVVDEPHETFTYLWSIHNSVNERLHKKSKSTEDRQFIKQLFPPRFLCDECYKSAESDEFDEGKARDFLINHYTHIRPHNESQVTF